MKMKKDRFALASWKFGPLVVGVLLTGLSCTLAPDEDLDEAGGDPDVASVTAELTTCSVSLSCDHDDIQTYTVDQTTVYGPSTSTHLCWASQMDTYGPPTYGSYLRVEAVNLGFDVKWRVSGIGKMSCTKQCCFSSNGGGNDVRWISENFVTNTQPSQCLKRADTWWGDAMTINQGMSDWGAGTSDMSSITYGGTSTAGQIDMHTCASGGEAYATSFFVGVPHSGHNVMPQASQFWLNYSNGDALWMMDVLDGICVFRRIGPTLEYHIPNQPSADGHRRVKIEPAYNSSTGTWQWQLSRTYPYGATNWRPEAQARCFYYDQSQ